MCLHVLSSHFGTFCPHVMQIFSILKEQLLLPIPVPPDSFTSSSSSSNTTIGAPYWEPVAVKRFETEVAGILRCREGLFGGGDESGWHWQMEGRRVTEAFDKERRELGKRRRQQQTNWLEADKALITKRHITRGHVLGGGEVKILSNYIQQRLWDIWRSLLPRLICGPRCC